MGLYDFRPIYLNENYQKTFFGRSCKLWVMMKAVQIECEIIELSFEWMMVLVFCLDDSDLNVLEYLNIVFNQCV